MITLLKRKKLKVGKGVGHSELFDFTDLTQAAKERLGYNVSPNGEVVSGTHVVTFDDYQQFLGVLEAIDCRPFTSKSVKRYRQWKAWCEAWRNTDWMIRLRAALIVIFVASILLTVVCGASALPLYFWANVPTLPIICSMVTLILAATGSFWLMVLNERYLRSGARRGYASWELTSLRGYRRAVPEFVLQTALDIQEKCPAVEFFVDELRSERERVVDPFLVAKLGNQNFYLEVWNEPEYRQQREV